MELGRSLEHVTAILEWVAVLSFAMSGFIAARRHELDPVGAFVLAFVTAYGGGTIRDIMLDRRLFYWEKYQWELVVLFLLALVAPRLADLVSGRVANDLLLATDAIGLAVFSVSGVAVASVAGESNISAALIGVISGVAGGLIRDILVNEIPIIMQPGSLYATCSFVGVCAYLLVKETQLAPTVTMVIPILVTVIVRGAAAKYNVSLQGLRGVSWRGSSDE